MVTHFQCPSCKGQSAVKNGTIIETRAKVPKYLCTNCGKSFSQYSRTIFWFGHYQPSVVLTAVEFRIRYKLSSNEIEKIFTEKFGIRILNSTVCDWVNLFAENLAELQKQFRPDFSKVWHVDEIFVKHIVKIDAAKHRFFDYLWVVYDDQLNIIATYFFLKREITKVQRLLCKKQSRMHNSLREFW